MLFQKPAMKILMTKAGLRHR